MAESTHPIDDERQERAAARVGTKLGGKWTLKSILGIGGMAAVFEAEHDNERKVAIKILHAELIHVAEAKERFLDEAYLANHVAHTGTVPALDDGVTDDGSPFLVMEFLDGETLESRWQRCDGVLPVLDVFYLMEPLLDVLRASHERGIVHRDIKPDNVFLTVEGEIKLLDFGIARMAESRRNLRTQVGATMGTPSYMAPEQARGRWEDVDERSDIWSLGATMFALICGRTVHEAATNNELLLASMTAPAPPVRTFASDVPEMAAAVIDKALAFDKVDRFASAKEMLDEVRCVVQALEEARRERGVASIPPAAGTSVEPPSSSRPPSRSTFRPVARSKRPQPMQASDNPRGGQHQRTLIAIALGMSALLGYVAVASLASNESASVAARQASGNAVLSSSRVASEVASATPVTPEPESSLALAIDTALDPTNFQSTRTGITERVTVDEKVTPPPPLAASERATRPVKPAVKTRPVAPAKKTMRLDAEADVSGEKDEDENFDPLRMRR